MKKSNTMTIGVIILLNACIWGFAMIMSAHTLEGTGAYQQIQHIMGGCAAMSLIVVGGGLGGIAKQLKTAASKKEKEG